MSELLHPYDRRNKIYEHSTLFWTIIGLLLLFTNKLSQLFGFKTIYQAQSYVAHNMNKPGIGHLSIQEKFILVPFPVFIFFQLIDKFHSLFIQSLANVAASVASWGQSHVSRKIDNSAAARRRRRRLGNRQTAVAMAARVSDVNLKLQSASSRYSYSRPFYGPVRTLKGI